MSSRYHPRMPGSGRALRGRTAEIAEFDRALDRAASGRLAVVLVEGEAGIGKSRLLAEVLDRARDRGFAVAAGRADEFERTRPFGVLVEAWGCVRSAPDPRRAAIAELLATHGHTEQGPITVSSDPGLQYRVVDAFSDLAEALALDRPLVLALDDLQWADPACLLTVATLARRLADLPVAIVATFRPFRHVPALDRLLDVLAGAGARRLSLSALSDQAVRDLVTDVLGTAPTVELLAQVRRAGGHPLYVTELLGALGPELPSTLRLTILRRLASLPDDTQNVLRAASILGSQFTLTELATTTGRSATELSPALTEALAELVLADAGPYLRFRHDLIRDAVHDDLPAGLRVGLHREAGLRLAAAGAPALRVAEQLARGAEPGDALAADWLVRAARESAPRSAEAGADLLERAIVLTARDDPGRDQLIAERAQALVFSGRIADAEAACRTLLARDHDPDADAPARICLGHALLASGRAAEGLRELERAAESPEATLAQRAAARAWAGGGRLALSDFDGALAMAECARADAVEAGEPMAISIAHTVLAAVAEMRGRPDRALPIIDEAVRLADRSPDRRGHRYPLFVTRGHVLLELDRLAEARTALVTALRVGEELGHTWSRASNQAYLGVERLAAGEWDDAITELQAALVLAGETGESYSVVLSHSALALIRLHRNDLSGAHQAVAAAERLASAGPEIHTHRTTWMRALLQEAGVDSAAALATLSASWDRCVLTDARADLHLLGPDLVRLAIAAGAVERAREVARAVESRTAGSPVPSQTAAALRCRGLADNDPDVLAAAVAAHADGPRPLELGLACHDAGVATGKRGRVAEARDLLERAAGLFERLAAARDLARTEAALRDVGIRRGRRGPRQRPPTGWAALTPTELTVAGLVAEGLTNPQIATRLYLSRSTVATHLEHVFTKLDIGSRTVLAAEVTRRAADPVHPG